jgi:hypothetical protein
VVVRPRRPIPEDGLIILVSAVRGLILSYINGLSI